MKVTILRDSQKALLQLKGGKTRELHVQKGPVEPVRSRGRLLTTCFIGMFLGFVISQLFAWLFSRAGYIRVPASDGLISKQIPNSDITIIFQEKTLQVPEETDALIQWGNPHASIQDSLLLSAILNIAQQNIREEITKDGFIIVEEVLDPDTDGRLLDQEQLDLRQQLDLGQYLPAGRDNLDTLIAFDNSMDQLGPSIIRQLDAIQDPSNDIISEGDEPIAVDNIFEDNTDFSDITQQIAKLFSLFTTGGDSTSDSHETPSSNPSSVSISALEDTIDIPVPVLQTESDTTLPVTPQKESDIVDTVKTLFDGDSIGNSIEDGVGQVAGDIKNYVNKVLEHLEIPNMVSQDKGIDMDGSSETEESVSSEQATMDDIPDLDWEEFLNWNGNEQ